MYVPIAFAADNVKNITSVSLLSQIFFYQFPRKNPLRDEFQQQKEIR